MSPTEKQMDFIHIIEEFAPIDFRGKTKEDASEYIKEYKKLKDRVLYKKQTTNKKFSFTVRLKSDKALIMKSMKYFIEKESK